MEAARRQVWARRIWKIGTFSLFFGIISIFAVLIFAESVVGSSAEVPKWFQLSASIACLLTLPGLLIFWCFGWRFYLRVQSRLDVGRSLLYLAFVIGLGYFSPIIFIIIEGKKYFFKEVFS